LTSHRSINRRFKQLAEELGLKVAEVDRIGWSRTNVADPTTARYAAVLGLLAERLVAWRRREQHAGTGGGSRNLLACACACPRRIRVAPSTLAAAPIVCGACDGAFVPDQFR
jgi:hypothetical protein